MGMVVPIFAQTKPKEKAPAKSPTAPAKKAEKTEPKKEEPAAEEAEPVIPGTTIARADGTFLGLSLEGGNFKLSFYDEKKKPVSANVVRATARWNPVNKTGELRVVLNPTGDGLALTGPQQVRPPFVFKVYLTLINEAGEAVESHAVDFRG